LTVCGTNATTSSSAFILSQGTIGLSRLHVDGKYIKNSAGEIVYLRGCSVSDLMTNLWFNNAGGITARINNVTSVIGNHRINVIECYISTSWQGSNFTIVVSQVDQLKNACVANNIYFIIKADHNGDPTPYVNSAGGNATVLANWFLYWVNRYANVPNFAGIDVFNEPYWSGGNETAWRATLQTVYNAVHAADPNILVLCPSFGFNIVASDLISNPIGTQAVPTFDDYWEHVSGNVRNDYARGNYSQGKIDMETLFGSSGFNAIQNTVPTFMNEFGWGDLTYDNSYAASHGWPTLTLAQDLQACNDWYYVLNEHGIQWSVYQLWNNPSNNGICNSSYSILTDWGQIWAQYLTGLP
jgi:hypothetical protein